MFTALQWVTVFKLPEANLTLFVTLIFKGIDSGAWLILITALKQSPWWRISIDLLTSSRESKLWVMNWLIGNYPVKVLFTSFGTSCLLFHPPNAVPSHFRPVTNWNGLVAIYFPEAATPITHDYPNPLWADSKAVLITSTLPVQS